MFIPPIYKLPLVKADFSKLKIVLQNLIENAIKYTKEGKVEVVVTKKDDFVEVAVKDTGKGIPQEYLDQLFSKFYRVKKALEMDYGMGLGLYISKKIRHTITNSIKVVKIANCITTSLLVCWTK